MDPQGLHDGIVFTAARWLLISLASTVLVEFSGSLGFVVSLRPTYYRDENERGPRSSAQFPSLWPPHH
ncbi:hypothetical protein MY3296_001064 [Beauveria thailandica]